MADRTLSNGLGSGSSNALIKRCHAQASPLEQRTHLVFAGSVATPSRRGSVEAVWIGWPDNIAAEDAKEDTLGFLDAGPLGIDGVRGRT